MGMIRGKEFKSACILSGSFPGMVCSAVRPPSAPANLWRRVLAAERDGTIGAFILLMRIKFLGLRAWDEPEA